MGLGRYDEAIEEYRKALLGETEKEGELAIRQNLSLALYKAGRFQEAASEAEQVLAAGGASRETVLLLGDIYQRLGEEEKVVALLTPVAAEDADDKAVAHPETVLPVAAARANGCRLSWCISSSVA